MKIGIEVEGRFAGLLTMLLTAEEALAFFERPSLVKSVDDEAVKRLIPLVRHIRVNDQNNMLFPQDVCLKKWGDLGFVVCLERTLLKDRRAWPDNVKIVLVVEENSFWMLDKDDQIKFSRPGSAALSSVENLRVTYQHEKTGDVNILVNDETP